jgi:hypothetical protein
MDGAEDAAGFHLLLVTDVFGHLLAQLYGLGGELLHFAFEGFAAVGGLHVV